MIRNLLSLGQHRVQIAQWTGTYDLYGERQYSAAQTYRSRVNYKSRMVRAPSGEEVVSTAEVWFFQVTGIQVTDKITLPNGNQPQIIQIARHSDQRGDLFEVVYV